MNTLSRAITARFFSDPEQYQTLRRHWSALVNSPRKHELNAAHFLLYAALLGKDWRKGFTPITNKRKLDNGNAFGWGLFSALRMVHSDLYDDTLIAPFEGLLTAATLATVRRYIPKIGPYSYRLEAYQPGVFPFDSYVKQQETAAQDA